MSFQGKPAPFLLKPSGKDYLWGGRRLKDEFGKEMDLEPLAETWECSTHPDGPSYAAGGIFDGQTLAQVLKDQPQFLGTHPKTRGELPILVKLIDARQDLSVQVHPDDAYAAEFEKGQPGKTEMWYVLDAAEDAHLIYGLNRDVDQKTLRRSMEDGSIGNYLQKVKVSRNDLFYIPAGTIHAAGAGTLLAEIQENSNLTYRLYDYDRVDKNGRKRPLHIEKALEAADLCAAGRPRQPMRVLKYRRGCAEELLCRCEYFEVHRMLLNTESCRALVSFRADETSFRVLLCTEGCGLLITEENNTICFF